ncbi:MAG: type II secretion system GspH family protein [Patescibacteria group bacterium]|nr:type II secretion system GspH family protein [Patescibacteria group bacterium]
MKNFPQLLSLDYQIKLNFRFLNHNRKKGFTIIELLIVVSILGILATFALNTFPSARQRAADARRQSDLKQYQAALEAYANSNDGRYPARTTAVAPSELCGSTNPLSSLSNCPVDPTNGNDTCGSGSGSCSYVYRYVTNALGTEYALWARLRRPSDIPPTNLFFIICSNGRTGTSTTQPSSSSICPL